MAYSHIQQHDFVVGASGSPFTFLTSNPTTGNTVCVAIITVAGSGSISSVQDSNGNLYSKSPSSPAAETLYYIWLYYLLNAPSNATNSLVVTYTGSNFYGAADEFHNPLSVSFDTDAAQSNGVASTTINTPSIIPSAAGNLLYAGALSTANKITGPTSGNTSGGWTGGGASVVSDLGGAMDVEYILSASGSATPVSFPQSTPTSWASIAMSFTVAVATLPEDDQYIPPNPWPNEYTVTVF